jgi:hypothetical protein
MRNEALFVKIDQYRNNRKNRWNRPYYNFHKKLYRCDRFLNLVFRDTKTKIILHEALSHYVISDITAMEVYFKDIFLAIFKYRKGSRDLLEKCHKAKLFDDKFDFEQMIKIEYENYTLPYIVLQYQNFQDIDKINTVFTAIVGKDFFKLCSEYKGEFEPEIKTSNPFLNRNWKNQLEKYVKLRHDLIHDFNPKLRLEHTEIMKLHWNMRMFVLTADSLLDFNFIQENLKDEFLDPKTPIAETHFVEKKNKKNGI